MNEETGEIAPRQVTALVRPEPKPLYALQVRDVGGETETFHATNDHPWRVRERGWVNTIDLRPGDRVETASDNDLVVAGLTLTNRVERTYNLTVQDWHTFLVGQDRAIVHNQSLCARAAALATRIGRNQVFIRGSGGRVYAFDLAGRSHFEKTIGQRVATPHVKIGQIHTGPGGESTVWGPVVPMTQADLRTVTRFLGQ